VAGWFGWATVTPSKIWLTGAAWSVRAVVIARNTRTGIVFFIMGKRFGGIIANDSEEARRMLS
jgi:alkylation response protein AidB-like acyl-CoA dehydrogenase